jgi:phosphoglycolate phosphatase
MSKSRRDMTSQRPKAVLFDWDNTLVDTWPVIHKALHITFTEMGHEPWTLEMVRQNVRQSMRDSFPLLFGDQWEKAGDIYINAYRSLHLEHLKPLAGAEELLQWLKAEGIYSAVVSNKRGDTLRTEVAHLGWNPYFNKLVGSTDAAKDKPDPAPVHLALEGSGIPLDPGVWYIGDSDIDLQLAAVTGMTPVYYDVEALLEGGVLGDHAYRYGHADHAGLLSRLSGT